MTGWTAGLAYSETDKMFAFIFLLMSVYSVIVSAGYAIIIMRGPKDQEGIPR